MMKTPPEDRTITIENARVQVQYSEMPLDKIRLDPTNPRIQNEVRKRARAPTQDDLVKLILDLPGVSELFKTIRDNGGVMDPIYVRKDGTVVEGNCRAAIYMSLRVRKPHVRWDTIPALTLPEVTPRQIAVLQGQFHVAGKNQWPAYEKAGHIHDMVKLGMTLEDVARVLKLQKRVVEHLLVSYQTMTEQVLPRIKSGTGLDKWSYVYEFYKRKDLEPIRADPAKVTEFVDLVVTGKLKRGEHVRQLHKIMGNPRAKKALKKDGSEKAIIVVAKTDPAVTSPILRKLVDTTKALRSVATIDIRHIQESKESRDILLALHAAVREVANAAKVTLA